MGTALYDALQDTDDIKVVAAVALTGKRERIGNMVIDETLEEALTTPFDVLVDFTSAEAARRHALAAVKAGRHVVIGTTGLTDEDYDELDSAARGRGVGVVAVENVAIAVTLLQRFAVQALELFDSWEVVSYAGEETPATPGRQARSLAAALESVRPFVAAESGSDGAGPIRCVREPGQAMGIGVVLTRGDDRLRLQYEAGEGAEPFLNGTLKAIRRASEFRGVMRGLDRIL